MNRVTKKGGAVNACIITGERANCLDAFLIKSSKKHMTALSQILQECTQVKGAKGIILGNAV
jgi:hypothetical protein